MWGCLIGDACGVPYEFRRVHQLPPVAQIDLVPPADFDRAHPGTPPGTWSDDGAHAVCLLASLLTRGALDLDDLGARLLDWYERGAMAVDGRVFDVGITTAAALRAIRAGIPAGQAGADDDRALGNGSLMRVLPLALWHRGDDHELVADAHRQSRVTHRHPRVEVCCALYCLWARYTLHHHPEPWPAAAARLRALYADDDLHLGELEFHLRPDDPTPGRGGGYVVDCLRSARWAVAQGDYEAVVHAAIALGDDTDTTACVAGGIAGIRDGLQAIPARWRAALRGRDLAGPWIARLCADAPDPPPTNESPTRAPTIRE